LSHHGREFTDIDRGWSPGFAVDAAGDLSDAGHGTQRQTAEGEEPPVLRGEAAAQILPDADEPKDVVAG
jgi:hypothetical protein